MSKKTVLIINDSEFMVCGKNYFRLTVEKPFKRLPFDVLSHEKLSCENIESQDVRGLMLYL